MTPCNKKWFASRKIAKKKAKQLEQIYKCKYEVYTCLECGSIHLTKEKTVWEKRHFRRKRDLLVK